MCYEFKGQTVQCDESREVESQLARIPQWFMDMASGERGVKCQRTIDSLNVHGLRFADGWKEYSIYKASQKRSRE